MKHLLTMLLMLGASAGYASSNTEEDLAAEISKKKGYPSPYKNSPMIKRLRKQKGKDIGGPRKHLFRQRNPEPNLVFNHKAAQMIPLEEEEVLHKPQNHLQDPKELSLGNGNAFQSELEEQPQQHYNEKEEISQEIAQAEEGPYTQELEAEQLRCQFKALGLQNTSGTVNKELVWNHQLLQEKVTQLQDQNAVLLRKLEQREEDLKEKEIVKDYWHEAWKKSLNREETLKTENEALKEYLYVSWLDKQEKKLFTPTEKKHITDQLVKDLVKDYNSKRESFCGIQ